MRFSLKMALISGGSLLILAVVSSWGFSQYYKNHTQERLRTQLLSEGLVAKKLAEAEVELLAQKLILLLSEESALRKMPNAGPNRSFMDSDFVEIALVQSSSSESYKPEWVSVRPGYASRWPSGAQLKLLEKLSFEQVDGLQHMFQATESPDGQPLFAFMIPLSPSEKENNAKRIGVGFITSTTFASVMDPFRRSGKEASLFDEAGIALAYTSQQYVGSSLQKHPVVASILNQARDGVHPNYQAENMSGVEVLFSFEKLANSNLMVFVSQQPPTIFGIFSKVTLYVIGYAVALMLLLGGVVLWLLKPFENSFNYLQDVVVSLSEGLAVRRPEQTGSYLNSISESIQKLRAQGIKVSEEKEEDEKPRLDESELRTEVRLEAYREIGSGLGQALKGPMTAILGHVQLAKSKAKEDSLKEHFVQIEKEARRSRDTVENLLKISGESVVEAKEVDAQEAFYRASSRLQTELSKNGVRIRKNLSANGIVMAIPGHLDSVFEELIRNSIEAMSLSHPKEIDVSSYLKADRIIFEISDTGQGMDEITLAKAFDPFFTTKLIEEKDGLGLTVVKGLLASMNGEISLLSEKGSHTKVRLEIPLAEQKEAVNFVEDGVGNASELPQVEETAMQRRARLEAEKLLALFDQSSEEEDAPASAPKTDTAAKVFKNIQVDRDELNIGDLKLHPHTSISPVEIRKPKVRSPN